MLHEPREIASLSYAPLLEPFFISFIIFLLISCLGISKGLTIRFRRSFKAQDIIIQKSCPKVEVWVENWGSSCKSIPQMMSLIPIVEVVK
jgi:hypothetical protein